MSGALCTRCDAGSFLFSDSCVARCPDGFRGDQFGRCKNLSEVSECPANLVEDPNGLCQYACPVASYLELTTRKCSRCAPGCDFCYGTDAAQCLPAPPSYVCHYSCDVCFSSEWDQCVRCTPDRDLKRSWRRAHGECVCRLGSQEVGSADCYQRGDQASSKTLIDAFSVVSLLSVLAQTAVTRNAIHFWKYIDNMQSLSYLAYVNEKSLLQFDQAIASLRYFHLNNLFPEVFAPRAQQQTSDDYEGNTKLFQNGGKYPFLLFNCGNLAVVLAVLLCALCAFSCLSCGASWVPAQRKYLRKHACDVVFILTYSEVTLVLFQQIVNSGETIDALYTLHSNGLVVVLSIYALFVLGYYVRQYVLKRNKLRAQAEKAKGLCLITVEEQPRGIPTIHKISIILKKLAYSVALTLVHASFLGQLILIVLTNVFYLALFIGKRPYEKAGTMNFFILTECFLTLTMTLYAFQFVPQLAVPLSNLTQSLIVLMQLLYVFAALYVLWSHFAVRGGEVRNEFLERLDRQLCENQKQLFAVPGRSGAVLSSESQRAQGTQLQSVSDNSQLQFIHRNDAAHQNTFEHSANAGGKTRTTRDLLADGKLAPHSRKAINTLARSGVSELTNWQRTGAEDKNESALANANANALQSEESSVQHRLTNVYEEQTYQLSEKQREPASQQQSARARQVRSEVLAPLDLHAEYEPQDLPPGTEGSRAQRTTPERAQNGNPSGAPSEQEGTPKSHYLVSENDESPQKLIARGRAVEGFAQVARKIPSSELLSEYN